MSAILFCLALTVFQEARGEPALGQRAVATVVLNRAHLRNKDTCDVLLEHGQFSWGPEKRIRKVKKGRKTVYLFDKSGIKTSSIEWKKAEKAAKMAYFARDSMQNVEFFHAIYVKTAWKKRYKQVFVVGNHVFYARKTA